MAWKCAFGLKFLPHWSWSRFLVVQFFLKAYRQFAAACSIVHHNHCCQWNAQENNFLCLILHDCFSSSTLQLHSALLSGMIWKNDVLVSREENQGPCPSTGFKVDEKIQVGQSWQVPSKTKIPPWIRNMYFLLLTITCYHIVFCSDIFSYAA